MRPRGQAAAIIIGQAHAPATQLVAQAPVFFDQIHDDRPFPTGQPASQDHQQQLESGGVEHGPERRSRPRLKGPQKASAEKWNTTRFFLSLRTGGCLLRVQDQFLHTPVRGLRGVDLVFGRTRQLVHP